MEYTGKLPAGSSHIWHLLKYINILRRLAVYALIYNTYHELSCSANMENQVAENSALSIEWWGNIINDWVGISSIMYKWNTWKTIGWQHHFIHQIARVLIENYNIFSPHDRLFAYYWVITQNCAARSGYQLISCHHSDRWWFKILKKWIPSSSTKTWRIVTFKILKNWALQHLDELGTSKSWRTLLSRSWRIASFVEDIVFIWKLIFYCLVCLLDAYI